MQNVKDLSRNWPREDYLRSYKSSTGLKPYERIHIFESVRALLLFAVFLCLFGCGNNDNAEVVNTGHVRLDMIEDRLAQLEKRTQRIPLLESQLAELQASLQTEAPYHVVRQGDTLYDIAREYGLSVQELIHLNNLTGQTIYPGQKLMLAPGSRQ